MTWCTRAALTNSFVQTHTLGSAGTTTPSHRSASRQVFLFSLQSLNLIVPGGVMGVTYCNGSNWPPILYLGIISPLPLFLDLSRVPLVLTSLNSTVSLGVGNENYVEQAEVWSVITSCEDNTYPIVPEPLSYHCNLANMLAYDDDWMLGGSLLWQGLTTGMLCQNLPCFLS